MFSSVNFIKLTRKIIVLIYVSVVHGCWLVGCSAVVCFYVHVLVFICYKQYIDISDNHTGCAILLYCIMTLFGTKFGIIHLKKHKDSLQIDQLYTVLIIIQSEFNILERVHFLRVFRVVTICQIIRYLIHEKLLMSDELNTQSKQMDCISNH